MTRVNRALVALILGLFTLLGLIYSIVVPPFEASDEKWHYPMVKYIADNWALPVQEPDVATPWRQEGSQAPLYYALGAAATFWIDTSDAETVRHLNPHVDPGTTPDGNVNLVVHNPALERFPWRGTALAVRLIRFISVLMGAAAVYLTYLIAGEVLPDRPALALGAAAVHAFTPMYIFIAGSVNNDSLAVLLCNLGLWMLIGIAGRRVRGQVREYVLLGIVLGLAALTKSQTLALAPITALVVIARAVRCRSWREFFVGGLAIGMPLLLIAGWWYWRNLRLYGDLTGLDVFIQILGRRDVPADLPQLWRERFSFLAGYWGNFGGLNVPMAAWTYSALNGIVVIAAAGVVLASLRSRLQKSKAGALGFGSWASVISVLWALGVFVPWLLWTRVTWSSQGRLVFYAISVWSLLLVLGVAGWLPWRWGKWAVAGFALFLLGLAAAVPFAWIKPAYALPEPLTAAQVAAIPHALGVDFGASTDLGHSGAMRLLGYDLETDGVEPGGRVGVTLYWQALAATDRAYTVFVHLLGEEDLLVAQRDTYPGLGLLSTMWLEPGYRWADRYVIDVPETAYAPDVAQIEVGLYDASTEIRLTASDGGDAVRFGRVQVKSRQGDVPNPISVSFGNQMELVGYDLDRRVTKPGEDITLTLYWRGLRKMELNYSISAQLVGDEQIKVAEDSNWPLKGDAPTALWEPGHLLGDPKRLTVRADAAPGTYDIQVTVYKKQDGELIYLPVISDRGEMLYNRVFLTRVRILP